MKYDERVRIPYTHRKCENMEKVLVRSNRWLQKNRETLRRMLIEDLAEM